MSEGGEKVVNRAKAERLKNMIPSMEEIPQIGESDPSFAVFSNGVTGEGGKKIEWLLNNF